MDEQIFIYRLLVHEVRPAPNQASVLSLAYSSVLQSSLQSCQCPLLPLFSCMSLSTSCPCCLLFISVSCHLSFFSSSAFHKFLLFLSFPAHPFLFCLHDPHMYFLASQPFLFCPPYTSTSHQVLRHINTPSEIPVLLVMEFLPLNQITDLKK